MNNKLVRYPIILGTVALIAGLLLALVYNVTAPIIAKNANIRENAEIVELFGADATITNIKDSINDTDKKAGVNDAYTVESKGTKYYVYKVTITDGVGSDNSNAIVALKDGKVHAFRLTKSGDAYSDKYASENYFNMIKGKNNLKDTDVVGGATATGEYVVKAVNATIAHYGRVK